ncbi:MAG: hypothetical protein ACTSPI_03355 [Candidatus Heimdallarchaeaceae archaeon]
MDEVTNEFKNAVQSSFLTQSQARGRQYGSHRASAPGQTPASWTGLYKSKIEITNQRKIGNYWAVDIKGNVPYARTLEYGGINKQGNYVAPRPLWRPIILYMGHRFAAIMRKYINMLYWGAQLPSQTGSKWLGLRPSAKSSTRPVVPLAPKWTEMQVYTYMRKQIYPTPTSSAGSTGWRQVGPNWFVKGGLSNIKSTGNYWEE